MKSEDLVLVASDDYVAKIAHENDPIRGIIELIWNSIDAEASRIKVELERNSSGGIAAIKVNDDGHGISADEVSSTFGRLGGSWKAKQQKSKNDVRTLHGKLGHGRLRAFALGSKVVWESIGIDSAGVMQEVVIEGVIANRDRFGIRIVPSEKTQTGTQFVALNEHQKSFGALEPNVAVPILLSNFAPILLNDPSLKISYCGVELSPASEIFTDSSTTINFGENKTLIANIRIIEWKTSKQKQVFFGPDIDHFPLEMPGKHFEKLFSFSAYVSSEFLGLDELTLLGLQDSAPAPLGDLWILVRDVIRGHFSSRRRDTRRAQVEKWRTAGIYPYSGEPSSEPERVEQAVFNAVSEVLVPHISSTNKEAKLTLGLLKDALRSDPENLSIIINEVVGLGVEEREALSKLLSVSSLSAIIRTANTVANRLKFLTALEHLIFDPVDAEKVKERNHLHKILENELWIFGEGYNLMSSEKSLNELLKTHLKLEGLPVTGKEKVLRWDSKTGRTDLHLAAKSLEHDRTRHLVVELKAPEIKATRTELDQVEDYANAVLNNPAFRAKGRTWDFILVVREYDEIVRNRIVSEEFELGVFISPKKEVDGPEVRAFVRRWRDVLDENRRRLDYMSQILEQNPTIVESLEYVHSKYADLLPSDLSIISTNLNDG